MPDHTVTKITFLLLLIWIFAMIGVPDCDSPWACGSHPRPSSDGEWVLETLRMLFTSSRDFFYVLAEFSIRSLTKAWDTMPNRLRPLIGVGLVLIILLSVWGVIALGAARRLSRRVMG
jgi:hypothetical protein